MLQESMRMVSRKPFRRFHNYLLGCAAEFVAPALKGAAKAFARGRQLPPCSWRRGLIISHTRIGDVLFRTCSLEQLKQGLPECAWHYLGSPDSTEVLRGNPFLNSVLPLCDTAGCLRLLPGAVESLRAMRFDVAFCTNPESYWQDHRVALAARIPNRVGFIHRGLSGLVTHSVPCNYPSPWAAYFRQMVACVTGMVPDWPLVPRIYPSAEDGRLALSLWTRLELPPDGPVLACFMTTREQSYVWPQTHYSETLRLIHRNSGAHIVLSGSKQDAAVLRQFAAHCDFPCQVMAGELGLCGLFCFLKRCSAVLTPDSGPRHIANAAGTPVAFIRNLFCSKIETGKYCENEIDLSPDGEFIPLHEQQSWLRRVSPALVAERILKVLRHG